MSINIEESVQKNNIRKVSLSLKKNAQENGVRKIPDRLSLRKYISAARKGRQRNDNQDNKAKFSLEWTNRVTTEQSVKS